MIDPITQRVRRTSDSQHNNKAILTHINPNIFAPYIKDQKPKSKPLTHRPKGKQNKKTKRSIHKEEFPDYAIKFRNQTFQSKQASDSFCSKNNNIIQNLDESFGKNNYQVQLKSIPVNTSDNHKKDKCFAVKKNSQSRRPFIDNKKFQGQFSQALDKIFKSLDVFNRGRISQTNINKWIPQSALYFLGGIFQKIRTQRMSLNLMQFVLLCKPLLFQSGEDDVKWFIEEVNGKQLLNLNISINSQSQENKQGSPVQMRMNHKGEKQKNRDEPHTTKRQEINFNEIANNMRLKQKQLNLRLNSIKDKHQSRNTPKNQLNQFSFFNNAKNNQTKLLKESSNQVRQPKVQSNRKEHIDYFDKLVIKDDHLIPSFTYKLPKQSIQRTELPSSTKRQNNFSRRTPQKNQNPTDFQEGLPISKTSRIVRQSIPKSLLNSSSAKKQSANAQQPDRLDKLSSRLQEYIQFNKQKIEQNKKFIRQNSVPRN